MFRLLATATVSFILIATCAPVLKAQQTIFNVPSQDILATSAVYGEVDVPLRLDDPKYLAITPRVVLGVGYNSEAGLNLPGYVNVGDKLWTAILAVKHGQTLDATSQLTLTEGTHLYVPLTSHQNAGIFGYVTAGIRPINAIRLSAGVYGATTPVTGTDDAIGALGAIEFKALDWLSIALDGYSGKNALGYVTPGLVISVSNWSLYPAYQISNTSRGGDSYLFEVGYSF